MKKLFATASEKVSVDGKYTHKIQIPQYEPSKIKPFVDELFNIDKYGKMIAEINKSSVSEDDKRFLRLAASRHIVFNYAKIADYYAHADKEVQELMEKSALVILDIDDAIANGYVKLDKHIKEIMDKSGKDA